MLSKNLKNLLSGLIVAFLSSPAFAANSDFAIGFDAGINASTAHQTQSAAAIQNLHPERFIPHYSQTPKETAYSGNPDSIKEDAVTFRDHDAVGKSIMNGMNERKEQFNYPIDPNSLAIKNIDEKADAVYSVITGQFGDCTKQTNCTVQYQNKVCQESPKKTQQYCRKILHIDFVPKQVDTHYAFQVNVTTRSHDYAGVNFDIVNGLINAMGPHDANATLEGLLPATVDCHSLHGTITNFSSANPNTRIDSITYPSCDGLFLDLHASNIRRRGTINFTLKLDIVSSKIIQEAQDRWDDQCTGIDGVNYCHLVEEHCIAPSATRMIDGTSVYRDCWEKEAHYTCGSESATLQCQAYRDQGCEQLSSICKNHNDGGCLLFEEHFRCPIKECTDVGMICHGETYCLTGDCVKESKQADKDFQRSVTALSMINEAAKYYNVNQGSQFPIFGGQVKTCNKDFINFADCCADSGWGMDLHLGQCNQEAQDLGSAKENNLTVYIDSEDDCVLGLCSHKKRYCVFPSKLARIIQEQGRRDQLHIPFGNFDDPDCRGLMPDEFSQLDLNKIDMSEIYSDITKKVSLEDPDHLKQRIQDKMKQWSGESLPHG